MDTLYHAIEALEPWNDQERRDRELLLAAPGMEAFPPWQATRPGCLAMNTANAELCAGLEGRGAGRA